MVNVTSADRKLSPTSIDLRLGRVAVELIPTEVFVVHSFRGQALVGNIRKCSEDGDRDLARTHFGSSLPCSRLSHIRTSIDF